MAYTIDFCIISFAYLSVTAYFYFRQAKVPSLRNSLFGALLICCLASLVLDIASAILDPYAYLLPGFVAYALNALLLLSVQVSGLLFFAYTVVLCGVYPRMKRWMRALMLLPFCCVAALIALSSVLRASGVFYLDAQNAYRHGAIYVVIYAVMALYLVGSVIVAFCCRRRLQRKKFFVLLSFLTLAFIAMLIQFNHPYLLVNTTANAVALTLIYHILEAPSAHLDALTGVFNRTVLPGLMRDLFEQNQRCTLLLFALRSFHLVNHSLGVHNGDAALTAFAAYLRKAFPKCNVIRCEGDVFAVIFVSGAYTDFPALERLATGMPKSFRVNSMDVQLSVSVIGVNSEDCGSAREMLSLYESVMTRHRANRLPPVLLAGADFKEQCMRVAAIERATVRALDEDRVEVYFQPIHDCFGRFVALEALVRVFDPALGMLPTQEMIELAEQNGGVNRLGRRILEKTCAFIRDNHAETWGLDHIGVNLSAVQCARPDIADEILAVTREYGVSPSLLAFEITETAAAAQAREQATMERLTGAGFSFLLDDFGKGYASFRNMATLPYHCVKIDKSLLWEAQESEEKMKLLTGTINVIRTLHLTSLCEGVETEAQAALLKTLGVTMLQGYLYARPLPPPELVAYVQRVREG